MADRIHVACAEAGCDRTGSFLVPKDLPKLRWLCDELLKAPWVCVYHDDEWQWHTRRPDREAAQLR